MGNVKYDLIKSYTMKCRLYPNKEQQKLIDDAIRGVQTFFNCTLYEMLNNFKFTNEVPDNEKPDELAHFPDWKKMAAKEWKYELVEQHPIIHCAPSSAITCKSGVLHDIEKALRHLETKHDYPIEFHLRNMERKRAIKKSTTMTNEAKKEALKSIKVPNYYNSDKPRRSYSYQEGCTKIKTSDNPKTLYIDLCRVGVCKFKGWNEKLRFGEDMSMNFVEFVTSPDSKKRCLTITISKDNCGDYWICFKLPDVYKPIGTGNNAAVGVDVGIRNIVTLSNGKTYENKHFKKEAKKHHTRLNRQLSRREGPANEEYRAKRKEDQTLTPSKRYEDTKLSLAKLDRKMQRKRENWNNQISHDIVQKNELIAVESLSVKEMQNNKYVSDELSDAALYDLLNKIKYKAAWHNKELVEVGRYEPTTKRCNNCGYVKKDLGVVEKWRCPHCGVVHDADINAARNILDLAIPPVTTDKIVSLA